MRLTTLRIAILILVLTGVDPYGHVMAAPDRITALQAGPHGMRYYLALPTGWKPGGSWPVLVAIPDAARQFEGNLRRFVAARGDRPYILVAPEVLTCGGARSRTAEHYTYTPAEWKALRPEDDFRFDDEGLVAVLAEVHKAWGGVPKAVLTGWEAGGHLVWAEALRSPQRWRAVAPVTTNYQARYLDPSAFSAAPERSTLPIQVFRCGAPSAEVTAAMPGLEAQIERAIADARSHGFAPRPVRVVAGADHGPLPEAVLAWCDSLPDP